MPAGRRRRARLQAATITVDLEQRSLLGQALTDRRIDVGEHAADYADLREICDVGHLLTD